MANGLKRSAPGFAKSSVILIQLELQAEQLKGQFGELRFAEFLSPPGERLGHVSRAAL